MALSVRGTTSDHEPFDPPADPPRGIELDLSEPTDDHLFERHGQD